MKNQNSVSGHIVDVVKKRIFDGALIIENGNIIGVTEKSNVDDVFILPGLVDAHVHIESSMLTPCEFAKASLKHGVVAAVADPHEIANVLGVPGIDFMIEDSKNTPFMFHFGAPSCVPATNFESSGALISANDIEYLFASRRVNFLSEMMNFPGVINSFPEVIEKLKVAKKYNAVIDGHAPGLRGDDLQKYIDEGITTDHECFSIEEAREKISMGMKVLIREGSAAKNLEALYPLINEFPDSVMLCTDDIHPDDLVKGHINLIIQNLLVKGCVFFNVIRAATFNPVKHYNLSSGLLQEGDKANFILVKNITEFKITDTYINGIRVTDFEVKGKPKTPNNFKASYIKVKDIEVENSKRSVNVISVIDKELITKREKFLFQTENNLLESDIENDILKIVVLNRYNQSKPSVAFVKNFGLKEGAVATTVAHDSHNIIAIGCSDIQIVNAINKIIDAKGGMVFSGEQESMILELPIAGLISDKDAKTVAEGYKNIDSVVKKYGSKLTAPLMTMSFLSLLVIPELKLSDKGLFDFKSFGFISLYE